MFAIPMKKIAKRIQDTRRRTHNMPEDMAKEEIEAEIERGWEETMGKAERYVQGAHILKLGGYFSTMSMGNWHTLCEAAGVELIPSRVVAVINPIHAFDMSMNGVTETNVEMLQQIANGIQDIADDEIIRFDTCASSAIKVAMTLGRDTGATPSATGWFRKDDTVLPELPDERILSQLMENPENSSPVWVRKWVEPVMMKGDARAGYQAAMMPGHELAEDEEMPEGAGDLFPCEWRVFVKNGKVTAIGNYYPQIARGETPEDEKIALEMADQAREAAERLIEQITELKAVPHHPRYEHRDGFDPDAIHFSLDFIEVEDEITPTGRRLVMIEGGPAHLRAPAWGAHPVSFGTAKEPEGVALSTTDIRPLSALDA
jgi:hypothetical protein